MRSFIKFFFASFLALIIFSFFAFLFMIAMFGRLATAEKVVISANSVLVVNLPQVYNEQHTESILPMAPSQPGLYDVVRLIRKAAADDNIKGIYLKTDGNGNGYASSEELYRALLEFRKSKKFVYAYSEILPQNAYALAVAADKVYLNPKGSIDFSGYSMTTMYLKGTLEKLDIEPQIFYNGKFKSATEPLRETKMTDANRVQTTAFLNEMYGVFLDKVSKARGIDTATLRRYANELSIQFPEDAVKYKLVDALKYDDEVMDDIKKALHLKGDEKVNFVTVNKYHQAKGDSDNYGNLALIYAEGDIVGGTASSQPQIASEDYIKIIREARQDKDVKAIVLRVNSPGGSALASEGIWRELTLARKAKPVIVSMGNYAASGGYYIACMADSIFAEPTTLTGSIGVFAILPNMKGFFNNKLGITFDNVKTGEYADLGGTDRPLTEKEKAIIQRSVDSIYATFKGRVVEGRKLSSAVVDSISQGRVWTGVAAQQIGLVDRIGGIDAAIACAAKMANLPETNIIAYPKPKDPIELLMKTLGAEVKMNLVKEELGEQYRIYQMVKKIQQMTGGVQARMPGEFVIE